MKTDKKVKFLKTYAIIVSILYALSGMSLFILLSELDDAPGLVIMGLVIIFAPMIIVWKYINQTDKNEV